MKKEMKLLMCKSMIRMLEGRLELLEYYRNKDLGKEILDILNDIKKYKKFLVDYGGIVE